MNRLDQTGRLYMAIITISRELAALGDETANELAKQLGYHLVDKYLLEEKIKSYGITGNNLRKYDEKKPSFFAAMSQERDDYLHFLKSAILAEAGNGNTIFIGRGTWVILRNVPGVFSVFLVAPGEIRQERVKNYYQCDDKRALQIIGKSDHDREGFHRYFFGFQWKDPGNYHLSLNTGLMQSETCAEIIKAMLDKVITKSAGELNVPRIRELTLAEAIKHSIVYEKEIPIYYLEVSVSDNRVFLYGVANVQTLIDSAIACTRELVPDYAIQSEIQVIPEYDVMP